MEFSNLFFIVNVYKFINNWSMRYIVNFKYELVFFILIWLDDNGMDIFDIM